MSAPAPARKRHALAAYLQPKTLQMLLLGFSSGIPFLLIGNTLGYWLRDEGISLTLIGFISWAGLPYTIKFLWAPLIDRVAAPGLGRLGLRRSWMALSQVVAGLAFVGMAVAGTANGLGPLAVLAVIAGFAAATQDIVIDAWRIESASDNDELGLLSSAYQLGYRVALLATDAIILALAEHTSWPFSYTLFGLLLGVGLVTTFFAPEPLRADLAVAAVKPIYTPRGLFDAIAGPFIAFFRTFGWIALLMLVAISFYRVPDFIMGPMVNPYYHDIGLTKDAVAAVRGTFSFAASLAGIALGGLCALRFGYMRALVLGGILQATAIAAFAVLATTKADLGIFIAVMIYDSIATSFAGVALVSYMSSLTSLGYTATQYALLASSYAFLGKFLKGFSGQVVEALSRGGDLMHAYAVFFIGCGLMGVPGVLLFVLLSRIQARREDPAAG
jgi:MFS transporter, PAT family, beta-lactamase induction signal transducer AmpG